MLYGILMVRWLNYPVPPNPGPVALFAPFYQLGYAAAVEEPVFRGFLWGGLRRLRLQESWIVVIQAILFTAAHIHLLDTAQPLLFFGMIFVSAMIMGVLVWRSHRLSSSMAFHGFSNGSAIVQFWVYSLLFQ